MEWLGRLYRFEHDVDGFPPADRQVRQANADRLCGQLHGTAETGHQAVLESSGRYRADDDLPLSLDQGLDAQRLRPDPQRNQYQQMLDLFRDRSEPILQFLADFVELAFVLYRGNPPVHRQP